MQVQTSSSEHGWQLWRAALPYALATAAIILGMMYTWFALADRYTIFLYYHDMGPYYPHTGPFSRVTISRYWMTGLVASGGVMVIYMALAWLLGRLRRQYRVPDWWRVWAIAGSVLVVGIPWITMTCNWPALPWQIAAQVTAVALVGLAFALLPARLASERPWHLLGLGLDGGALMLFLLFAVKVDLLPRWIANGSVLWIGMWAGGTVVGFLGLLALSALRAWRRWPAPAPQAVLAAGCCVAYLLMPLAHYVVGTDGYFYLTDSDNFFAQTWPVQLAVWLVAVALVYVRRRIVYASKRGFLYFWATPKNKETSFTPGDSLESVGTLSNPRRRQA